MKLSVVLATYNEEKNLADCLASIKDIADEIVIVDGTSTDQTVAIAESFGAIVQVTTNHPIFHINKQKALELAQYPWILQLDADERVSKELAREIKKVIEMDDEAVRQYQEHLPKKTLYLRHQHLLEKRDGAIGTNDTHYAAFFIPRRNYFLGRYLLHGGVYPDGVIRLVKNGKAQFPAKDVHEQIVVEGKVGWLQHDLLHMDSPTFEKYLLRWKRYTSLLAEDIKKTHPTFTLVTLWQYCITYPVSWFLVTYFRHKGFLDGWQGFVFSLFSALRFPMSYLKYLKRL